MEARSGGPRPLEQSPTAESAPGAVALQALTALGFTTETDWRPVRVELTAPVQRWVDLHPVVFDATGHGRQADLNGRHFDYPPGCFTTGTIAGRTVPCLAVDQQLRFHTGYAPRPHDRHDLALLQRLAAREN